MSDDKKLTVSRSIPVTTEVIFDFLTLPANHVENDSTGTVVSVKHGDRISATGQVFSMNMNAEMMGGDYVMENHVTAFLKNKMVGWQPAQEGKEPGGWEWLYELEPEGDGTLVTLTYDWSKVTDPAITHIFPAFPKEKLEESLNNLAAAVSGS